MKSIKQIEVDFSEYSVNDRSELVMVNHTTMLKIIITAYMKGVQ